MRRLFLLALIAACSGSEPTLSSNEMHVTIVPQGSTCASLGFGGQSFTIANPTNGIYHVDASNSLLFRYYDDTNTIFFFTQSSLRMNGVMIESGGQLAVWELPGANGWPSLHGAIDPSTGALATPTAVTFCFDYELYLNPNAYASYGLSHAWSISKTGVADPLTLSPGQTYDATYEVRVTPTSSTYAGLSISGPVFVDNPNPLTPTISDLTVLVGDLYATVTCPFTFPHTVPAFTTLACEFKVAVPDTTDRLVYVDIVTDGGILVDRSLETASFADHNTNTEQIDECITVHDSQLPYPLGWACLAEGPKTFTYTLPVGPYAACGPFSVENTATYVGLDTGATGSSSWTVSGTVPCAAGCTLSAGYWKTHSELGPAPYDAVWAQLGGAATPFFLSGGSYHGALSTPPGGNAYWTLSRAFAAAQLNALDGASTAAITATFAQAEDLLEVTTPADVANSKTVRNTFVRLAAILNDWNSGLTGPGHCDE